MSEDEQTDELTRARDTIARQLRDIERLQAQVDANRFAEDLREALIVGTAAGTIATPVSHGRLLEMIVETAAHVISANAASLFTLDERAQELVFEVALGQKADEVRHFRVPVGHGIAGLVALTGQPMAIADAQSDPRQAADIAEQVGYAPDSILCVPLFYNDQIIGVLELLDKTDGNPFTAGDMTALGLFAGQAAVAIEQSRAHRNFILLVRDVLLSVVDVPAERQEQLERGAHAFALALEDEDAVYGRALQLARLVQEIVQQGENETAACTAILRGFADYLRVRARPFSELEAPP